MKYKVQSVKGNPILRYFPETSHSKHKHFWRIISSRVCLMKHHAMKTYWEVEVYQRSLNLRTRWLAPCSGRFYPQGKSPPVPIWKEDALPLPGAAVAQSVWLGYGLNDPSLILGRGWNVAHRHRVQTGSVAHPASYPMGTGGKAAGVWSYH
jgi:hypothetical protein